MDPEKLKKMQQSVRIGTNRSNVTYAAFDAGLSLSASNLPGKHILLTSSEQGAYLLDPIPASFLRPVASNEAFESLWRPRRSALPFQP